MRARSVPILAAVAVLLSAGPFASWATAGDHFPELGCEVDPSRPDSVAFTVYMLDRDWWGPIDRLTIHALPNWDTGRRPTISFERLPKGWSMKVVDDSGNYILSGPAFEPVTDLFLLRSTSRSFVVEGIYSHVGGAEEHFVRGYTCASPAMVTSAGTMSFGSLKAHYR